MFTNVPKELPIDFLSRFDFGDVEAKDDALLKQCPCTVKATSEFLIGRKDIVIGDRGAGKSALFRLIKDKILQFDNGAKREQVVIPIEEELQYSSLKQMVLNKIADQDVSVELRFRVVWELFIFLRVIDTLSGRYPDCRKIKSIRDDFHAAAGIGKKKIGFMELVFGQKKSVGVKLEQFHTGMIVPNFYTSFEPSANAVIELDQNLTIVDLELYKNNLCAALKEDNRVLYVLIDKLDEFAVKEDYETQKLVLQGLLLCQRGYSSHPEIKIKLFLRTDLFRRLDFQAIGYDKIISRTTELDWAPEDIRMFVAKRLFLNYLRLVNDKHLEISFDSKKLTIGKKALRTFLDEVPLPKSSILGRATAAFKKTMINLHLLGRDSRDARVTNFGDEINRQLVTLIFPRDVTHFDATGKKKNIDIFEYIETHFSLGNGRTTPRIILMFLQNCLEIVRDYYRKNPDTKSISLDNNSEYPVILREHIISAYSALREQIWETIANGCDKWKPAVLHFKSIRKKFDGRDIQYKEMKSIFKGHVTSEEDLKGLLALFCHVGVVKPENDQQQHENRLYRLPIIFR